MQKMQKAKGLNGRDCLSKPYTVSDIEHLCFPIFLVYQILNFLARISLL